MVVSYLMLPVAQGMYYEAVGRNERAEEIYKMVIGEEPSNEIIAKRMVRSLVASFN